MNSKSFSNLLTKKGRCDRISFVASWQRCEPLAQLAEHLTFNQRVRGSNPRWLTRRSPFLRVGILFFKTGREKRGFSLLFLIFRVGQREKKEDFPDKGERLAILSICTDMSRFVQRQKELEAKDALSDYLFMNLPGGHVRCSTEEGLPFFMGFSVAGSSAWMSWKRHRTGRMTGCWWISRCRIWTAIRRRRSSGDSRKKKAGIPILAMTANAFATDRKKALEMGMNGHIAKPIDGEKIQDALAPILMEKGTKG